MATVAEVEQFNVRLTPTQKARLEMLAFVAGKSLNQYIALLIDSQYEAESDMLEQIEELRKRLTKTHAKHSAAKKNHARAA